MRRWFAPVAHGAGPVSYTHLDVYKRQILIPFKRWRQSCQILFVEYHQLSHFTGADFSKDFFDFGNLIVAGRSGRIDNMDQEILSLIHI